MKKKQLNGVYLERDVFRMDEITLEHMNALKALGVELEVDGDARIVKIKKDTSEVNHSRCGDPLDYLDVIG